MSQPIFPIIIVVFLWCNCQCWLDELVNVLFISMLSSVVIKGLNSTQPADSCKDIRDSKDSQGDGEYWIDPEKSGNPLKVFCDMTTDGGKFKVKGEFWRTTRRVEVCYLTLFPVKFTVEL